MTFVLFKGGRIISPIEKIDRVGDLLVKDSQISVIDKHIVPSEETLIIDAAGMVISPGFIDIHCHLREPGFEYKETVASGTKAAAKGGFTTVCAMPNTNPAMDSRAMVDFVVRKAEEEGSIRVLPIGCVTKGSLGKQLSEMGELAQAGVIGFSDDGHPVADSNMMRQALRYSSSLGLPIINHCEVPELFKGGSMNEGWVSNRLGIKGIPNSAEEIMVARDIALAELTGGRYHVAHISTPGALELVKQAKAKGINVTCEVTPHHLTLSEEVILGYHHNGSPFEPLTIRAYETQAKVNPPLRTRFDVDGVVEGLKSGVIDIIATDHAPHNHIEKLCTFEDAAFGISVLETALGSLMSLVHVNGLALPLILRGLTSAPATFIDRPELGNLKKGTPADITMFDPNQEWEVDSSEFLSRGKNTPLQGQTLKGRVVATMVGGKMKYSSGRIKNI